MKILTEPEIPRLLSPTVRVLLKVPPLMMLLFLSVNVCLGQSLQRTDQLPAYEPIEIIASVTNKRGDFVRGLRQENFHVFIDKIQQKIERLSDADEPVSIGIVVDASGSIQNSAKMQELGQVISQFQALSNQQNEYFLIAFNETPDLLMDWSANLEPGLAKLITVKPFRHTAFFDACYVAAEKVNRGRHRKRVLLLISDGQDNVSRYTFNEVRELFRETDIIVYGIAISMEGDAGSVLGMEGRQILQELTELSGGFSFFNRDGRPWRRDELTQVIQAVARSLRNQYKIRLTPTYKSTEKWHRLKIKLNMNDPPKGLKDLSVRAREGFYLVPTPSRQ